MYILNNCPTADDDMCTYIDYHLLWTNLIRCTYISICRYKYMSISRISNIFTSRGYEQLSSLFFSRQIEVPNKIMNGRRLKVFYQTYLK